MTLAALGLALTSAFAADGVAQLPELGRGALRYAAARAALRAEIAPDDGASPPPAPALPRVTTPLSPELRAKGWNPCMTPDRGFGAYSRWLPAVPMGQMIVPEDPALAPPDGAYHVILHFHGHDAVRKPFVEVARGEVLVGIDLGVGSGAYEDAFALPAAFTELREGVLGALRRNTRDPGATIGRLTLSSWSAGYGAVQNILRFHPDAASSVVLLDSAHAGYVKTDAPQRGAPTLATRTLAPFVAYAERAARGDVTMVLTHSDIQPPGYASTREVADHLLREVGVTRHPTSGTTPLGLVAKTSALRRGLTVKGYGGNDEHAHCAHTELLAIALRDVLGR
ncbi:MAG: hypothetical protein IT374_24330 [Polyangiaceae bacterium]|nr:hypothetical protein [Polyangiaceae bacterium]